MARLYPYFAMGVAGATWVLGSTLIGLGKVQLLFGGAHYTTMFWLLIAPVIDTGIRGSGVHDTPAGRKLTAGCWIAPPAGVPCILRAAIISGNQ